ncbi:MULTISPECIES: hypothetical protein [Rhizobium]|uniref:hypothetical protein n=1 Tax=Rhizobium TaxID=379 RepID=UPI0015E6AC51|nr:MULTISPECIES: hypothetical protein [Rhizobium]
MKERWEEECAAFEGLDITAGQALTDWLSQCSNALSARLLSHLLEIPHITGNWSISIAYFTVANDE